MTSVEAVIKVDFDLLTCERGQLSMSTPTSKKQKRTLGESTIERLLGLSSVLFG